MNRLVSVYLDLIRFSASLVVFFAHTNNPKFTNGFFSFFKTYGNDAVIVFFVLSGFVIAYCVDAKEKTLKEYLLNRFARLYSVVFPALCFTVILDFTVMTSYPELYAADRYKYDNPLNIFL
jgi:peptidoglycan/LPS O-acetylase OafA/YrhL